MVGCLPPALNAGESTKEESSSGEPAASTGSAEATASPTTASPTTASPTTTVAPDDDSTTAIGGTTTGQGGDDVVFLVESDQGASPIECSTMGQDCPPGQKCLAYSEEDELPWSATRCVPIVAEPHGVGEPCTVVGDVMGGQGDDCDGTSMCWDVDPVTRMGTCVELCTGSEENPICNQACTSCMTDSSYILALCLPPGCDPLLQDCPRDYACQPYLDGFECSYDPSGGVEVGSPCDDAVPCQPGLACMDAALVPGCPEFSASCCAPFCPLAGPDPCAAALPGTSCVGWNQVSDVPLDACVSEPGVCVQP